MKALLLLSVLVFNLMATHAETAAQKLNVFSHYDKALAHAQKNHKVLLVVVVKEHCSWCDKMVERTLQDPEVKKASKTLVTVILDQNAEMPSQLNAPMTPTSFFVDPRNETVIFDDIGYIEADEFLHDIENVVEDYSTKVTQKDANRSS